MIDNQYKEIETLTDKENGPILVRHNQTKEFFVKKIYSLDLLNRLEKLKQINHKNLPKLQEIIPMEKEIWVYEEFIHGKNLQEYMLTHQLNSFTTETILSIADSVTEALAVLHERKIIHRDIKLTNIMISSDGVTKLIDFDAIRFYDGEKEQDTVNLGTMGFAAPEHFGFSETDERSDLYSLGVVLNVCDNHAYPNKKMSTNPYLVPIITKAIRLDPLDRFQTANEMNQAIKKQINALKKNKPIMNLEKKKMSNTFKSEFVSGNEGKARKPFNRKSVLTAIIPGFRTNTHWKKIVAAFGYTSLILCYIILGSIDGNTADRILMCFHYTILMVIPLFFFLNFLNIQQKLPLLRSPKLSSKLFGYLLYAFIWFIILGIILEFTGDLYSPDYYKSN